MKRMLVLVLRVSVHLFGITDNSIGIALGNTNIFFLPYRVALDPDHCRLTSFFFLSFNTHKIFLRIPFVLNNSLHVL